ncbi:type I toxin-antitoxin system Fst family toxin [Listeria sp. PSOL-1]
MLQLLLLFSTIVAPLLVGMLLATYRDWLGRRNNK